jgi:hypothetical protein
MMSPTLSELTGTRRSMAREPLEMVPVIEPPVMMYEQMPRK